MKKILLFILLIASVQLIGQEVSSNIVAGYPVKAPLYQNDFSANITGFAAFNGSTVSHDSGNGRMQIVNPDGGASRAVQLSSTYATTEGSTYLLAINVDLNGNGDLNLYTEWADLNTEKIDQDGWNYIQFTVPTDGGGDERLLISQPVADTFWINYFALYELVDDEILLTKLDEINLNESISIAKDSSVIYQNSFEYDISGVTFTNMTAPTVPVDNGLEATTTSSGSIVTFAANEFNDTMWYNVDVNVTIVDQPLEFFAVWGSANASRTITISSSGWYHFSMFRKGTQATSALDGLSVRTPAAGTIRIEYISIKADYERFNAAREIRIGEDIDANYANGAAGQEYNVLVGSNVTLAGVANTGAIVNVGNNANFGTLQGEITQTTLTTGEAVNVGGKYNIGARSTSIGFESSVWSQSGTAIGVGAELWSTHGIVLGRGAYSNTYPTNAVTDLLGAALVAEPEKLYLGNGWFHRSPEPYSGQSRGTKTPSSTELEIHGQDAFDARYPAWDSGTTYRAAGTSNKADIVFYSDTLWYSQTNSNLNNTPSLTSSDWEFFMADSQGAAADFNVDGGDLGLYTGMATGTGTSGSITMYVGQGSNGDNTKDSARAAMEIRSEEGATTDTYVYIRDNATGTLRKVLVKDKPAQSGTRKIIGFSRLQLN